MASQAKTERLLTVKDLPFPRTTVWRLMKSGKLACYRVGRRLYFSHQQVSELLQSCEQRKEIELQNGKV